MDRFFARLLLVFCCVVISLAACSGPAPEPTAVPTPTPTPRELATRIGEATQAAESLHFDVTLAGRPVVADPNGLFVLLGMEGDLKRPNGVLAILRVKSVAGIAELRTVSLDGKQYLTNPITRQWQCVDPGYTFDPAVLFDAERGVTALIRQDFEDVTLVGIEDLNERPHYHLSGVFAGEKLRSISLNLLGSDTVRAEIWADRETLRASKVVLVDTNTDPSDPSTWTLNFNDYGKVVDVRAPVNCS